LTPSEILIINKKKVPAKKQTLLKIINFILENYISEV
jgi:hypothetical protein